MAEALSRRTKPHKPKKLKWISKHLKARVDLSDKEAVNEILDRDIIRKLGR